MPTPTSRRTLLSLLSRATAGLSVGPAALGAARAADEVLRFGVGLYQPDKEKNHATYRPLAEHLSRGPYVRLR